MMIGKLLLFGRRQLHTIISREIIKPSSPTPSHLQTYNLSRIDQGIPHIYIPLILFYPNKEDCSLTADDKARKMKKSLSQSLTRYYPFAGRLHTPTAPYIDCSNEGVVFVEAKHDCQLDKFQHMSVEDHTTCQLFADDMVWQNSPHSTMLVGVQLNHFACGGIGLAVSMSHKIGDGCTLGSYISHWASVARYGSTDHKQVLPLKPHFIQSPPKIRVPQLKNNPRPLETSLLNPTCINRVSRKFVFPNSKLNDLKNKVLAEAGSTLSINNPTRVEVLSSLIYKTAVAAATPKSGSFKPSFLVIPVDMRKKVVPKLPQTTVGNLVSLMMVTSRHECETSLSTVVSEIKKQKMELEEVQSMQQVSQKFQLFLQSLGHEDIENFANRSFTCSSLCGFPYNKVDFGWGKPTGASLILSSWDRTGFALTDTSNGDGIEAQVTLVEQNMEIFRNDKELLTFCQY
ncbi:putative deacetylvindoline O-acetyltransferase [Helianthus annuus]|uniref:Deacetylvindoline O-acetyltransferase n=1 Tax=Helianthus annuus TaxID=4232 RepID=A0A251RYK8_HELAN|nr:acylsugar acyltransferase 3 [Helianthus annuus]KAF5803724.1 putative deacetylvindoline O-acetyltransferase [Helianthus annuus]KAJ0561636.1 putative deacetylvindoline O-acetyltransferase [Helianthus annuus]KAJ0574700.1 putative deacetylvindoline O-acetyltransferase [Helianthus annuus]KAJ0739031.1 putative deacetylvindoline O-acetyltransferase [Helianthus annuus]KAJ0913277.1 putative deacetylvindoline O-acetyltransferase [Helianthus annuus]